jgi:DNA-binding NarL/FixJ family response regulator
VDEARVYRAVNGSTSPRILVADAQGMSRLGIQMAIERAGFGIVPAASTALKAVVSACAHRPQGCVLDLSVRGDGMWAAQRIKREVPETAMIVLSQSPNDTELRDALRAGVSAYLPNEIDATELVAVLRAALAGHVTIPGGMVGGLIENADTRQRTRRQRLQGRLHVRLTSREWDVMDLLGQGLSTRDVAAELGISLVTVRRHSSDVMRKLGAPSRPAALALLREAEN